MDSYTSLLEKTRVPQPSLQKFAVISIFSKLRTAPVHFGPDSEPGRHAISQCLRSSSPAVVDQAVRELCRLVLDSNLDIFQALLDLQSVLEGSDPKFATLFVKSLGFLVRVGFERSNGSWTPESHEDHPFVKILSSRREVEAELVNQVLLFMAKNKGLGMVEVCEFLRPFLNFSILRIPFSDSSSILFVRRLISSMTSLCCSFPNEAIPIFSLLITCLKYFPRKSLEETRNFGYVAECVIDSFIVVLRQLVGKGSLTTDAQLCGVELIENVLSLYTSSHKQSGGAEPIVELLKHMLTAQKDLALQYIPELSSVILSLSVVLIESELEHEQLSVLKFIHFLLKWKSESEYVVDGAEYFLSEELLVIFPIISLISSPSKSVKGAATDLLVLLERLLVKLLTTPKIELAKKGGYPSISRPELITYRLLQHLWFQDQFSLSSCFFLSFASLRETDVKEMHGGPRSWAYQLKELALWIVERRKSGLPVPLSQQIFLTEMPLLLGAITAVLVMHPSLGSSAIDALASIGIMDPKLGVPLLLAILFYNNIFIRKDVIYKNMQLKLLGMLPSLALRSGMIPLVVQTILPMLHKDAKPVLYATATRLLCQTWEVNDRVFGSLQGVLLPEGFTEFMSERNICISMAVSIRDVCRKNPDRGVDLILSVSACIESPDPVIQSLGFQSLAHLCEADVIDFYTAWDVIAKHVQGYHEDPVLAYSVCLLLRWGAMDADAYPEASREVMKIVWGVGCSLRMGHELQWAKAKASAFEALTRYEIPSIVNNISNFKQMVMDLLLSEINPDVLKALEGLQVKIIGYEHSIRRRYVKEKKVPASKIEKLLDVFPQVIFSSGKRSNAGELPGAALLCGFFTPNDLRNQGTARGLQDSHSGYEDMMVQIAASLQLSRNIVVALLSLQSWKAFVRRWMRANILSIDAEVSVMVSDKTSKAANDILKIMMRVAEESIPRSAENIALAISALCAVLPPSAHTIKSTASKFLLGWLFQYEHEHRQWSAAMSLGLISSSLHVTDHKQKFQNITGLLEVLCCSKSPLVKGACGIGLGFSCQDLLSRVEATDDSTANEENHKMQEERLLGRIVRTLSLILCPAADSSANSLESLCAHFPASTDDIYTSVISDLLYDNCDDLEDDIWGIAGLVIGLGSSIGAIFRRGAYDAVLKIKDLIISWIPHMNSLVQNFDSSGERSGILLSVGSCLALPLVVAFCQRVEMVDGNELDHLVNGYMELISELLSVNKSDTFHKSLLMASTTGAGSLLACILNEGVHVIEVERVNCLLELLRKCYSSPYPPIIHLGGMLGVVNALGAGAGNLFHFHPLNSLVHSGYDQKEHSYISGPILVNPACEEHSTSLMQEIFLMAQNPDDHQLQQYAAWAVSFLRHRLWSREIFNSANGTQSESAGSKSVSQGVPEDSAVMKLGLWLKSFNHSGTGSNTHIHTVATILRCLSLAPRLPTLDWGAIVRRCMRYEAQVTGLLMPDIALKEGTLREECLHFALVHAKQFDVLLTFLDELADLSRFRTLELSLQSCLLSHLGDLVKLFSGSRLEKLLADVSNYLSSVTSDQVHDLEQKSSLQICCWKGLYQCLDEASLDSLEYIKNIERCMEVLFSLLPTPQSAAVMEVDQLNSIEWSEAVRCLAKARHGWLLDFLQVSHLDSRKRDVQFVEVLKKIQAKAKLARIGSISLTELGKLKSYLLNSESLGTWGVLLEVVATLQLAEGSVKRQWLVDAVEISCVSSYPSTVLQFLGLLSGSCCKYMPLLILDRSSVLSDLPVTLTSLLSEPSWEVIAETLTSYLLTSTERIYSWATKLSVADDTPSSQPIDRSENDMAPFLLRVMHHACVCLKEYLPLEKQLRLANMVVM
ncbi:protein RST1 isoform X2 [Herrania umbratica]|uniref:Protein RST1 isoform X2 n=1 Tax=Herrania umbratica TaxID=108875 RepID=A0A6J1BIQ5_9ROSI|nr:protein RST1 isoform X2 [Herrania umbratica]